MLGCEQGRELDIGQRGQHQRGQSSVMGDGGLMGDDADPPARQGVGELETVDAGVHFGAMRQRGHQRRGQNDRGKNGQRERPPAPSSPDCHPCAPPG